MPFSPIRSFADDIRGASESSAKQCLSHTGSMRLGSLFSRFPSPPTRRDLPGDATQCASDSDPGLVKDMLVFRHNPTEVCAKHHRSDLENQLIQVGGGLKLTIVARLTQRHDKLLNPLALKLHDPVAGPA